MWQPTPLWRDQDNALTMVNKSDVDCRLEETSLEGAAGSSATTTAPGAPGVLESPCVPHSLYWSIADIMAALILSGSQDVRCLSMDASGKVKLLMIRMRKDDEDSKIDKSDMMYNNSIHQAPN